MDTRQPAMSSQVTTTTYKLYQDKKDQIAQWLVERSNACDSDKTRSGPTKSSGQGSSMRLKGKARKEARKLKSATNGGSGVAAHPQPPASRIRISQFPELARKIMESDQDNPKVPVAILELAQDVLELRKEFERFNYNEVGIDASSRNNLDMRYLKPLEELIDILKPGTARPESMIPKNYDEKAGDRNVEALSDHTDLEGLSKKLENLLTAATDHKSANASATPPNSSSRPGSQPELAMACDDMYLALYCLFKDINSIRHFVRSVWTNFALGQKNLVFASVMTNTAIDLVKCIEEDFLDTHVLFKDGEQVIRFFYGATHTLRDRKFDPKLRLDDWLDDDCANIAQWSYVPVKCVLRSFCNEIRPGRLPYVNPQRRRAYEPQANRIAMSVKERFEEDKAILTEALNDCALLALAAEGPGEDHLTKSVRQMWKTRKISLALCFASQVYLDTSYILRHKKGVGLCELQRAGVDARDRLHAALNAPRSFRNWPGGTELILERTIDHIKFCITDDTVDRMRKEICGPEYSSLPKEPFDVLLRHPQICGTFKYHLALKMRQAGTALAFGGGSVLYVAHLYNALRQTSHLDIQWPQLEACVSAHTPEKVFLGDCPTTIEECNKRCMILLEEWAGAFVGRNIVRKRSQAERIARNYGIQPLNLGACYEHSAAASDNKDTPPPQETWEGTRPPSPLKLMELLERDMTADCRSLDYDYFMMHFQCMRLLRKLRSALYKTLVRHIGHWYIGRDDQLPLIAGYIIAVAVLSKNTIFAMTGGHGEGTMLEMAGAVMKDFIGSKT